MRSKISMTMSLVAVMAIVLGCLALLNTSSEAVAGRGGPPAACCDPADEPGVGGNPFCFEGHTCCSSGQWGCNNADGSPSCAPGEVCEAGCAQKNESCNADADCCSGVCKPNGRCK